MQYAPTFMSNDFWKKLSTYAGYFPLGALFAVMAFAATVEIKDLDLWLHLAVGKFITLNGFVPRHDILSCTIAGVPWENHEWLFQVLVYNLYHAFGPQGLQVMQAVVVTITLGLLLLIGYSRDRQTIMIIGLVFVSMIFMQRFTIRPDIFSLMFFAFYIYVLSLHIDKKWAPLTLFLIQIFWVNMHGFFFFGPLFVLIGLLSEWIKRHVVLPYDWNRVGRLTNEEYGRLQWVLILVVIACFLNPGLAHGAWYPIGVFFNISGDHKIFFDYIQELRQPITWETLFDLDQNPFYKGLIFISLVSFIFNRRRIDISALFIWAVFLIFSIKASRNLVFFGLAAYMVILNNMFGLGKSRLIPLKFTEAKFLHLTSIIVKVLLFFWVIGIGQEITDRNYYDFDKYERKSEYGGISQRQYPDKAVDFMVANNISGNFFNDFNSGAYLLGRTFPNIKVFIDGRTEAYGPKFFKKYREIWVDGNGELFEKAVNDFNLTGAFLGGSTDHIPKEIIKYIYGRPGWALVYFDYDGVIFLRDVPQNKELIEKFKIDLTQWKANRLDLTKVGAMPVKPYRNYDRAYTLEALGHYDQALDEARAALEVNPSYSAPYEIIGKVLAKQKNYEEAFKNFRIAAMYAPEVKQNRYNLAIIFHDMNNYDQSIKQFERIRELWPEEVKAQFFLAKLYALKKDYPRAMHELDVALKMDPRGIRNLLSVGVAFAESGGYEEALQIFNRALETHPDSADVYLEIGKVYQKKGDLPAATTAFQKGLELDPENTEIKKALNDSPGNV